MRRQARISAGGALVVRSASALQVWLWLLIFVFQNEFRISRSIQPGYLDFDNLPETNFTCEGKVIGGYYADLETSCQMFHVCTVGQQEEPMDIKFLCLNGTVFDQETRVCERVDEVDCTKSEKFYSLNLELYGNTIAPPVTKAEDNKEIAQSTEQSPQHRPQSHEEESDPSIDDGTNISHHKNEGRPPEPPDSTEDPAQEVNDQPHKSPDYNLPTYHSRPGASTHIEPVEENQEEEEIDSENPEYEQDFTKSPTTTQPPTTTTRKLITSTPTLQPTSPQPSHFPQSLSPSTSVHLPILPTSQSLTSSSSALPSVDPALLSPQEFIYRHRGPGSEAISFQRQSLRPADGVYITHAPPVQQQQPQPTQFDHFQYESSRTAPRPGISRPAPFVQRPQPTPFRPTTVDPRDQLSRPGPSSQSSERYETSIKHRPQPYLPPLPAQRPLPFDPYYYDRKRSDDAPTENESSLAARSVAPPTVTSKPAAKPKSPPRVIVTASASVSDSNGKRLNYTVGNVVSAVKPIVPINYDDYKESDLIFDPFFLDVPKLQKRRKTRDGRRSSRRVFSVPATATISIDLESIVKTTTSIVTSQATTTETPTTTQITTTTTTAAWNPNDYVDDNYEPHVYIAPVPPLVLLPNDRIKLKKQENKPENYLKDNKVYHDLISKSRIEERKSLLSSPAAQSTSSQNAPGAESPAKSPAAVSPLTVGPVPKPN